MLRLGLCCIFRKAPIRFRKTTIRYIQGLPDKGKKHLSEIILHNAHALLEAIAYCSDHQIGSFRINSQFFPCYTHPEYGYDLDELPDYEEILLLLKKAKQKKIRLTFHPDQFVVLNSPHGDVAEKSIKELEYHGFLAEIVGADVINIHGGGAYGDKKSALERLCKNFHRLSKRVQQRLTLENDDRVYTVEDLLPICKKLHIPLVYDIHHHRCLPDTLSIEEATKKALKTWNREPLFHVSSPKDGWGTKDPKKHHNFIDVKDIPEEFYKIKSLTLEIEAKAKELAIEKLLQELPLQKLPPN